jgi:nucleoside-diphosphate-sugar epimerase
MNFLNVDLRDAALVGEIVRNSELIFNLAARSGAIASNESPLDDLSCNCQSQLTLLEACRQNNPLAKIVFASSRLVYSPGQSLPVPETATTNPLSLYGVHKLAVEKYHLLYSHLYGLRVVILRITNPFGPYQRAGQNHYGIINWFIQLASSGATLSVYGDGKQLRDYIYIDNLVEAMMLSGISEKCDNRIFNVGSGEGIPFSETAELIVRLAKKGTVRYVDWPRSGSKTETGDFVADISLIKAITDWRPAVSFTDGLGRALAFYAQRGTR